MARNKLFVFMLIVVIIGSVSSCIYAEKKASTSKKVIQTKSRYISKKSAPQKQDISIINTSLGQIVFKFYPKDAPNHVANFKKLAQSNFYDNTTFHRVIPGFMIQGGDPNSKDDDRSNDGTGGPGYTIKAEFNTRKHLRGTVSMARSQDPDSAGSQFFICVAPQSFLDGNYTVFGQVIEGMDVVDSIVNARRDQNDNPFEKIVIKSVTIKQQ